MTYLREPLTYREKIDSDADRRFDRMDRAIAAVCAIFGVPFICWLIVHGKAW